jgi:hypothetical protein
MGAGEGRATARWSRTRRGLAIIGILVALFIAAILYSRLWVLVWLALGAAAMLTLIPRLGPAMLRAARWPRIPLVGGLTGFAATLVLLTGSCAVFVAGEVIAPLPPSPTLAPAVVRSAQLTTIAAQPSASPTVAPPATRAVSASPPTATPSPTVSAATPTPVTPSSTFAPTPPPTITPAPTQNLCGAAANPWGYNFCGGSFITAPPSTFCTYFNCIASFWNGVGYVMQCRDLTFSLSGGRSGSCSSHGGNYRALYAP